MNYYFKGLITVPASINVEANSYEEALASIMKAKDLEVTKYPYDIEGVWVVNPDEEDFSWELVDYAWELELEENG